MEKNDDKNLYSGRADLPADGLDVREPQQNKQDDSLINREAFLAAKRGDGLPGVSKAVGKDSSEPVRPQAEQETFKPDYEDEELLASQQALKSSLIIRLFFGIGLSILLIWLDTAATFGYMLPDFVSPRSHAFNFVLINFALLLAIGGMCFSMLRTGFVSLFTFRADSDSLSAVVFLAAVVNLLFLMAKSDILSKGSVMIFTSAAGLYLVFNLMSKIFFVNRIILNLNYASGCSSFSALRSIGDYDTALSLAKGLNNDSPYICAEGRARMLTDFIGNAYAFGKTDKAARVMSPAALICAVLFAVADFALKHNVAEAVTCFTTICCVCAPLMFGAGEALPMYRTCKSLIKSKAILTGSDAVEEFYYVNVLAVKDQMIFPADAVAMHGVKTYSGYKIENAILNAASVSHAAGSPMASAFMAVIEGGNASILKEVDGLTYEDELGISCWIDNRRILLGSRELMRKYGIFTPSRDYEAKYLSEGRDILYFSDSGELSAMFIVEYMADKHVISAVRRLQHTGISLLVDTADPNINSNLISEKLGISRSWVKVLGTKERELLKKTVPDNVKACEAGIAFNGGFRSYVEALTASVRVRSTIGVCTALQIVSMVLGILLMVYMTFLSGIAEVNPVQIMTYQGLWALPVLLIACLRRH